MQTALQAECKWAVKCDAITHLRMPILCHRFGRTLDRKECGVDQVALNEVMQALGVIQGAVLDRGVDWATVLATLIGGALAIAGGVFQSAFAESRRIKHERDVVKNALLAEISAVKELCDAREYLQGLRDVAAGLCTGLEVNMPAELFIVYRANLSRLGLLSVNDAASIIRFYGMVEAVAQDIRPGGMIAEMDEHTDQDVRTGAAEESASLLEAALELAEMLTRDR